MSAKLQLKDIISKTIRCTLKDHRIVEGILTSTDKFGNHLLSDVHEYTYHPGLVFLVLFSLLFVIFDENAGIPEPEDYQYQFVVVRMEDTIKTELVQWICDLNKWNSFIEQEACQRLSLKSSYFV